MKKKFAAFSVLAAGTIFASPLLSPAYAETNQDKLSNIQSELEGKQSDLQNKSVEKEQIEKEIQELQKKMNSWESVTALIQACQKGVIYE